ncbi:MAG: hypothetical protein EXS31_13110 [Pedosphaera sp.]|nr:hypothetical protein [Pedosphaera sp.]
MADNSPLWSRVGRAAPASGAHVFLGQPNIFFVSVNAKDRDPWVARSEVQRSLEDVWRNEATA